MRHSLRLAGVVLACGCGQATLDSSAAENDAHSVEHGLTVRLKEKLGATARLKQVFGHGDEVLLGVALEDDVADSDVQAPLALASYRRSDDALDVVAAAAAYREAVKLEGALALVTTEGELKLRGADGAEQLVATGVKGEVVAARRGELLFTVEAAVTLGDSAVVLAAEGSTPRVIADGDGVDDRPSVSPDQRTVVFVSGRTGIASLWRTTLDGEAPVQLTNVGIEAGVEREGEPAGFVPPPVVADAVTWVSADVVRYDAGGGEYWTVNVRTAVAMREGALP